MHRSHSEGAVLQVWLKEMELESLDLSDSGLPGSFLEGERCGLALPLTLTTLEMADMAGFDEAHDPYERMTRLPCWLGAGDGVAAKLRSLDLSLNQIDLRAEALPWTPAATCPWEVSLPDTNCPALPSELLLAEA